MRKFRRRAAAVIVAVGLTVGFVGASAASAQAMDSSWGRGAVAKPVVVD